MIKQESEKFIKLFNLEKNGFYDASLFDDGGIGFSVRKKFINSDDKHVSQIGISIWDAQNNEEYTNKKNLIIHATYGKISEDGSGVYLRSKSKLNEPMDLEVRDEFYYDTKTRKIYKGEKEVDANEILNEVYEKHIKLTKPLRGLILRIKILFWRRFCFEALNGLCKSFYCLLYFISGDKYSFEAIFETETLNNKIISSKIIPELKKDMLKEVSVKNEEKVTFFTFKVSYWPIIVYSFLHLTTYVVFMLINFRPKIITTIFKNNFLTVIYAVLTIWILEIVAPKSLMYLIRKFSGYSSRVQYKIISV